MEDYAVKVTIRNARILRRMRQCGYNTNAELARAMGVCQTALGKLINLKAPPIGKNGDWADLALDLCAYLRCDPEDLWSEAQREMALRRNSAEIYMDEAGVAALASGGLDRQVRLKLMLDRALGTLHDREREILVMRSNGATLAECGSELGLGVERVRQIEDKAARKLRGPIRSRPFRDFRYSDA